MPDPKDLNLNQLVDVVRSAFETRKATPPDSGVLMALARVVKGVLMIDNVLLRAAVLIAAQRITDAYLEGGGQTIT